MATRRHRTTASGKGSAGRARTAPSADSAADALAKEDKSRFLREWLSPSDGDDDDGGGGAVGGSGGGQGGSHSMRRLRLGGSGSGGGATDDEAAARAAKMREDPAKRMKAFRTRTVSTVVLIGGFFWVVWAGHVPLMLFVLMLQILIVREAFGLGRMAQEDVKLPWFRAQQWYFFAVTAFYLYLSFISRNLMVEATEKKVLLKALSWVVKRHLLISFFAYCGGFVMFVLSLKRGRYMYQFAQYAWTHMIILMVIMPTSFFVSNMFQGIIWYLLPALMIITNDICAYLAGFFFGRTPLIKLSPKKTWEGFAGGALGTALVAFFASRWLAHSQWLTCPRTDLSLGTLHCSPSRIFQDHRFTIRELAVEMPGPLEELLTVLHWVLPEKQWQWLESRTLVLMPMQLHALVMSVFASLIAPFGGFFASGFKRAFRLKDFGDTIPGHGGITDRFDCQVLMAVFSYLYYWNYICASTRSVADVVADVEQLSVEHRVELLLRLHTLLVGTGLLPEGSTPQGVPENVVL